MKLIELIKKYQLLIIAVLIISVIIVSLGLIYSLSKPNFLTAQNNLKDYNEFRPKLAAVLDDKSPNILAEKERIARVLNVWDDGKISIDEKSKYIDTLQFTISAIYSFTNQPQYRVLAKEMGDFIKLNFPTKYIAAQYKLACADNTCADEPQPLEIIAVIEAIKNSDFPSAVKNSLTTNIINTGYLPKEQKKLKAKNYLQDLEDLKNYSEFTKTGVNKTIYNMLNAYIQKEFSEELKIINLEKLNQK